MPPGFTITTEACQHYLEHGNLPEGLADEVNAHLAGLESAMGKKLGQSDDPRWSACAPAPSSACRG